MQKTAKSPLSPNHQTRTASVAVVYASAFSTQAGTLQKLKNMRRLVLKAACQLALAR